MVTTQGEYITRNMALHRYHSTNIGAGPYIMQGGGLRRYHTPVVSQGGGGLGEELVKVAGPSVVRAIQNTMQDVQRGKSIRNSVATHGAQLKRNLKRKAPSLAWEAGSHIAGQQYKKAKRRVKDIFGW